MVICFLSLKMGIRFSSTETVRQVCGISQKTTGERLFSTNAS